MEGPFQTESHKIQRNWTVQHGSLSWSCSLHAIGNRKSCKQVETFPKDTTDHPFSVRGRENKLVSVPFINMWKYFSSAEFTSRLHFLVSWDFFCISLIWVCCESCLTPNPFA